ncbi:MAG: flotillin family protein [Chloroflexi bacterium]|nr:flotillin family protein [Chloroflexota bacterium]
MGVGIVAFLAVIFVFVVVAAVYASRVQKVGPNEVLVISGRETKDPDSGQTTSFRIVKGGRAFIWPILERVDYLSLELFTIEVSIDNVYTVQGVPIAVEGVAQIKIASDSVSIRTASERFLSKTANEIINVAHETLAGHLRAIVGTLTVEEVYRERDKFAQSVQDVSATDLSNMGLGIDSFVIKDIRDGEGYLEALGRPQIAAVKRDAVVAEQLAAIREQEAKRDYGIKEADYFAEVNQQKAESDLAYELQQNITLQKVREQEVEVEVVSKRKNIELQQQEALRKERELEATVRKPAEAEQFRIETLANARRFQIEAEAQGNASAVRLRGEAEADAIRAQGLAQADVIKQQGLAEAEAMRQKAEAWQQYNQAAIINQLIDALPAIASAIAEPLSKTERIAIISTGGDGNGGGAGASRLTADIANIITQIPETVSALTGIDLLSTIKDLPGVHEYEKADSDEDEDKPKASRKGGS